MTLTFGPRRGIYVDISERLGKTGPPLTTTEIEHFEAFDLVYPSWCALMYNYVPMSGHPGGSISSGRFVAGILFDALDYDVSDPDRADADQISYAAGHQWPVHLCQRPRPRDGLCVNRRHALRRLRL